MQKQSKASSIKVFVRVRPLVNIQNGTNSVVQVQRDVMPIHKQNKSIKVAVDQYSQYQVTFDHAFNSDSTQGQVYKKLQTAMPKVMEGYNMTIFAYGQTGSGKTHTMFGQGYESKQRYDISEIEDEDGKAGVIPRSIYQIFSLKDKHDNVKIFCSFIQIYNEKIFDLLQNSDNPKPLNIHESKVQGIFVEGLTQFGVQKFDDCMELLKQGVKNRTIRQTSMNAKSSRSHTIFQLLIQIQENGKILKGRLNLCDLAGSQKVNKKQAMTGQHMKQLKNINLSLTTLGKVIYSLSAGQSKVAAFRQSKLTRLLQQSLTGNTFTFIFGNLSPSFKNMEETINTLKFVERANHITLKVKPTELNSLNPETVGKLKKQIEYLKDLLQKRKNGVQSEQIENKISKINKSNERLKEKDISKDEFEKLVNQNKRMRQQIDMLQVKIQSSSNAESLSTQYRQKLNRDKRNYYMPSRGPSQSSDNSRRLSSSLVQAGKSIATIDHDDAVDLPQNRAKQKLGIIKRLQQIQDKKKHHEYKLIDELDGYVEKHNKIKYVGANMQQKKGAEKGKVAGKRQQSYAVKKNLMKVDYSDKIKELEARLFKK